MPSTPALTRPQRTDRWLIGAALVLAAVAASLEPLSWVVAPESALAAAYPELRTDRPAAAVQGALVQPASVSPPAAAFDPWGRPWRLADTGRLYSVGSNGQDDSLTGDDLLWTPGGDALRQAPAELLVVSVLVWVLVYVRVLWRPQRVEQLGVEVCVAALLGAAPAGLLAGLWAAQPAWLLRAARALDQLGERFLVVPLPVASTALVFALTTGFLLWLRVRVKPLTRDPHPYASELRPLARWGRWVLLGLALLGLVALAGSALRRGDRLERALAGNLADAWWILQQGSPPDAARVLGALPATDPLPALEGPRLEALLDHDGLGRLFACQLATEEITPNQYSPGPWAYFLHQPSPTRSAALQAAIDQDPRRYADALLDHTTSLAALFGTKRAAAWLSALRADQRALGLYVVGDAPTTVAELAAERLETLLGPPRNPRQPFADVDTRLAVAPRGWALIHVTGVPTNSQRTHVAIVGQGIHQGGAETLTVLGPFLTGPRRVPVFAPNVQGRKVLTPTLPALPGHALTLTLNVPGDGAVFAQVDLTALTQSVRPIARPALD